MRYVIHGAGAVGSLVGGMLAENGFEVVLIARQPHADAVNRNGLVIRSEKGDRLVKSITAVTEPAGVTPRAGDCIILAVKTAQTASSVQTLRETFEEETPVFCLQNGVRNEELAARRFMRVYGAMPGLSATIVAPGIVSKTLELRIGIGNYPLGCDEVASAVGRDLAKAGFSVTTHERVLAVKWSKLLMNLNNATLAIIDMWVQLARVTPQVSHFMADVQSEGQHVLDVAGVSLADASNPYDINAQIAGLRVVTENREKIDQAKKLPFDLRTYPSTWVDLKNRKRETEAGYFNGEIVLLGEKLGIPTPYNSTLLQTVEQMAASETLSGRFSIDELVGMVEERRFKSYSQGESH